MQLSLYMSLSHLKFDSKRGPIDIAVHGNVNYFGNYGLVKFNLNPATVKAIILFNNSLRPSDAYIGRQTNPQCSDNGLLTEQRQAIIWTNDGISYTVPLGTNFSEISIGIQTFSFKKMYSKLSSSKRHPYCLGLNGSRNASVLSLFLLPKAGWSIAKCPHQNRPHFPINQCKGAKWKQYQI